MSHYQHFEEENHLQYDKLCGGKQAQNDPCTKAQGGGGGEGKMDGLIIKPMAVAGLRISNRRKRNHF